jgi:hypothetical protein
MPEEDLVELKFRIYDGSDIGPFRYSPASTVATVKERIVAEWPKGQRVRCCVLCNYFEQLLLHVSVLILVVCISNVKHFGSLEDTKVI